MSARRSSTYQRPSDHELFGNWFRTMSLPGRKKDGSDTGWFVVDLRAKRPAKKHATYVGDGDAAREKALGLAKERNVEILTRRIGYHRRKYERFIQEKDGKPMHTVPGYSNYGGGGPLAPMGAPSPSPRSRDGTALHTKKKTAGNR